MDITLVVIYGLVTGAAIMFAGIKLGTRIESARRRRKSERRQAAKIAVDPAYEPSGQPPKGARMPGPNPTTEHHQHEDGGA